VTSVREKLRENILDQDILQAVSEFIRDHAGHLLHVPEVRNLITVARYKKLIAEAEARQTEEAETSIEGAVSHNLKNMQKMMALDRPQLIIAPLVSIDPITKKRNDMKVLTIGPRTEAELLTLFTHGFMPHNVSAIDLVSYSPWVDIGDMHDIPHPDDSFDLVLMGWVLSYSTNPEKAAAEAVRVARPGAYISVGCEYQPASLEEYRAKRTTGTHMMFKTTDDILGLFGDRVKDVIFRGEIGEEDKDKVGNIIAIFTVT